MALLAIYCITVTVLCKVFSAPTYTIPAGGEERDAGNKGTKRTAANDNKLAAAKKRKAAAGASLKPSEAKGK